ncbi:MAG: biopolymer transporter ExbD [Kofleriaceae bacterium]|nr:biopolymer transporter ExbD [Kofleriaceae bacterium]
MTLIKPILLCCILLFIASCSDNNKRADTNTQPTANNTPSEPAAEKKTPDNPTLDAHKTLKKLSESARAYYAEPMSVAVPTATPEQSAKKTGEPDSDAWKALDFAMTDPHYYAYNFVADSEQPLSVFIDAAGKISIDGKAIKPSQLTKRLQKEREKNPSLQLIIHADKKTLHGQVVTVMDAAKRAGVEKIAIKQQGEEDNSALTPPAN